MTQQSLFEKYGGFSSVYKIVISFYAKIQASPSLAKYFLGVDMKRLIDHQTKFLCVALGGPNTYEGRSIREAHKSLNIEHSAFAEVAKLLHESLTEAGVEPMDINAVMTLIGKLESDVVKSSSAGI